MRTMDEQLPHYRSIKGVVANLVEALEAERDELAREVERLKLHAEVAQKHIDKLTSMLPVSAEAPP